MRGPGARKLSHSQLYIKKRRTHKMKKGMLKKITAGLTLIMLIALALTMGLADDSRNYFYVIYNANTQDYQAPKTGTAMIGYPYEVESCSFSNPGYSFIGWNSEPNGSGVPYSLNIPAVVSADLSLYAQWIPDDTQTVTITYKANANDSQADKKETVDKSSSYTIRPNPFTRNGYTFTGWNTKQDGSGNAISAGQKVNANNNYTLFAQWKADTVTITYKANANDGQADKKETVDAGSSYTVRANPFTRNGYSFTGWNTQANGSGNNIKEGQVVTANGNNTLYAQWKVNTVTITYKANAGDGQADVIDTINQGNAYTIKTNPFDRIGYTFAGWKLQANGSGNTVNPGQTFNPNANQTLYAIWNELPIVDVPTGVDGRILPAWKTGDSSDWIEIARNGRYSLIVRKMSVNNMRFGTSNVYTTSDVRKSINDFFNGTNTAISKVYDKLPNNANLRNYTVMSNALSKLGTTCCVTSLYDGFSKPTGVRAITGNDVCFALSYCESANFISKAKFMRNVSPSIQPVSALTINNFKKLQQSNQRIWLRTPGDLPNNTRAVACITYPNSSNWGTVFQEYCNDSAALVHPAVWVDGAVFN